MFAPKVAKPQTKAAEGSTSQLAPHRSMSGGHSRARTEPERFLQRTMGNQATLRLLGRRDSTLPGNMRSGDQEQEIIGENGAGETTSRGLSWDFSKIRLFPPERANRSQAPPPFDALRQRIAIQPMLAVGRFDDALEQEAGRAADEVIGISASTAHALPNVSGVLRRQHAPSEEDVRVTSQIQPDQGFETAGEALGSIHDAYRSPGQPLDEPTRAFFEPRFKHDFSQVRVHSDRAAAISNQAIDARAYTIGAHIIFGAGQYRPQSRSGLHLLAHELSHVIQQSAAGRPRPAEGLSGSLVQRQPQTAQQQPASEPAAPSLAQGATQLTQVAGAPGSLQSISFEGTIAAGQTLPGSDSDKTIHTLTDTGVSISVTAQSLRIRLTPALIITSGTWPHPDLELTEVSFNFANGTFGFAAGGPNYAFWLGHAKEKLEAGLAGLFGTMPATMRKPGYSPLADANIQANLASFFSNLSPASASRPAALPKATGLKTSATVVLGGEIQRTSGRLSLIVPSGTNVTIGIDLSGGIPSSLRDIRISSVRIGLWNPAHNSSNVSVRIADTDFPLIYVSNVTFASGGHLQFSYLLVTEVMEGFWRSLLAAAAVASGQGDKVGADAPLYDQPKVRAFVDSLVHSEVEPMLKQVVLENRHVIPGMDLGEALGFGPELGDFPSPKPGEASG